MAKNFQVYINAEHYQYMLDLIHQYDHERFACLMGNVEKLDKKHVIVIKEMHVLLDEDYEGLHTALCVPKKSVIIDLLKRAQKKRYSVFIEYHTHPFSFPRFSSTDKQDERRMWKAFHELYPQKYYGNMVMDTNYCGEAVIRDWHNGNLCKFDPIPY